jgi:hypothetical protein
MVARVYGRYAPRTDERDRWERIAAGQDAAREAAAKKKVDEMGTSTGTSPQVSRANHPEVIGSSIAGVGLEPTTPAL